jgi:hypothetical protein
MARRRLAQIRTDRLRKTIATQSNPGDLDILDFIPALNARYERPEHLAQIADLFRRIDAGEVIRALVTAPPQHGKSDFLVNAVARIIRRRPHLRNAYVCYGDKLVRKKSRQCRDIATAAGVHLRDDSFAVNDWQTLEGGGLFSTGVGGPLTGNPVDGVLTVDDPHKDREDAESALSRERVRDWWTSTAKPREAAAPPHRERYRLTHSLASRRPHRHPLPRDEAGARRQAGTGMGEHLAPRHSREWFGALASSAARLPRRAAAEQRVRLELAVDVLASPQGRVGLPRRQVLRQAPGPLPHR